MKLKNIFTAIALGAVLLGTASCAGDKGRIDVIFDSDANNELDDQHAIAYMLMNPETFNVLGITTNNTKNGGGIAGQSEEARRIVTLVGPYGKGVKVIDGAEKSFNDITGTISDPEFDGHEAVDFIIRKARRYSAADKLTLIAVGKLTNVALAIQKAPEIIPNIRLVWLGSNYPDPGEYNLVDDIPSMNYVLDSGMQFELVTVRYRKPSGTAAVTVSRDQAVALFSGMGPHIDTPVTGRHGGEFYCFGDYSANLYSNIKLGAGGVRSLFDVCAVAIVKNPSWAEKKEIPAPTMVDGKWVERPGNSNVVTIWENFDRIGIVSDFFKTICSETAQKEKKLIAFDLDATLTDHRCPLEDFNRQLLDTLKQKYEVIMCCAGNCPRVYNQMGEYPITILGNYGMQESVVENGEFKIVREDVIPVDTAYFLEKTKYLRQKYGFKDYYGDPVEFHKTGMVTFALLGTKAPVEEKHAFDPDRSKRRAMYEEVCALFNDYSVYIGGSSSFDFSGEEYNKYDAVMKYATEHGYTPDQVLFVGDDFGDGGGDSHVRIKGMDYVQIDDFRRTPEILGFLY